MDTIYTIAYRAMEAGNFHRYDDLWWDAHQKRGSFVSGVATTLFRATNRTRRR